MGQAWCKEKTSKAQDSKSPLDRVFVRCAHRIYPGLKEEGSVLGGATQRVTSSEIGYAGSPPREVLARGRSIDSVDRPFHPSEWVDVNLEVPNTPRASPVLTNLTVDTSPYPTDNHPTFADSNLKSTTPIPPPRRRKKNKGRPLPPKPDEVTESSSSNSKRTETNEEPLYSSVKSPKNSGDEQDADEIGKHRCSREIAARDRRRTKEIYEHKVNGTGRIISSDVVSGKRSCRVEEKKTGRMHESNHHRRKTQETDEYERFASSRTSKDSSTPNREDKRALKGETEKGIKDSSSNARPKNYSTVSLPNYDELDMARHRTMEIEEGDEDKTKPRRPVRSSTGSLPAESFLSPFSEKTSVRLEDYIPSQGSPDNLSAYQLLEKLSCGQEDAFVKYESASKSQDWDLGDVGNCESNHQQRRSPFEVISGLNDENIHQDEDVVDFSGDNERKSPADPNVSTCSIYLQKAEALGKATPALGELEYSEVDPNRSAEIRSKPELSDPPTLVDSCKVLLPDNSTSKEPFFLDEEKHRSALDAIGGSCRNDESKTIFTRSLSNESEPNEDTCETKDLRTGLIRSISEESLPKEMLEEQRMDQIFDEKHAKDVHNNLRKNRDEWKTNTPPPSPEAKTKNETMDLDHSTLLKVLKEEAAEESNLSSMTPSLTELEAALSDMLEKEDSQEGLIEESKIIEKSDVPVSLGQILKDRKAAAGRKVSFCSWEEAVAQSASRNDQEFTERPVDLDKRTVSHPNEDPRDSNEDGVVCPMDLPPEKPSRLNRSLDDTVLKTPTPPKRRHRSLQLGKKDALLGQNGSAYSNDRLI